MAKKTANKTKPAKKTEGESIRMFRDLILIRRNKIDDKTDGGIWIPNSVENEMLFWDVLEVGGGVHTVQKGDKIVTTPKHMGQEFTFNGEDLIVMRERNVWGIIG